LTRSAPMPDQRVVTYTRDGNGYGAISCSWETEPRKTAIAEWAAKGVAEGWDAELVVEGKW
jgi:hypothetical protein